MNMQKIFSIYKKPILALLLLALTLFSFSCAASPGQSPSVIPSVSTTPSPTVIPPTVSASPSLIPTATTSASPSPSASAAAVPTPTAPAVTGSPIAGNWTPPALSQAALPVDLSDIVAKVLPSVVSINVEVSSTNFLGQPTTQQGAGSGWVIDANGLIVTNNHVIEGAQNVTVSLNDGRIFSAQQISADPVTDLAVVKINATGLPTVTVGDSGKLKQGMMAIAIGNALGEGLSVTAGWISRLNVSLTIPASATSSNSTLFDLIAFSTPINPGNSGGPLIDSLGEAVGITNIKLVASGVENVGYAISTKSALPILQQLIQNGKVTRPYLGVSLQDVDATVARMYNLGVNQGALIVNIGPNSPAAQAGLKVGDVIVNFGNTAVNSAADAVQAILSSQIGQQVNITYYRGNAKSTVTATLVQNPNP